MKDLRAAHKIMGMKITHGRERGKLKLLQSHYISKVVNKYDMSYANLVLTPLAQHFKLSSDKRPKSGEEIAKMEGVPYASAVGSLMYSMTCLVLLAYFMSEPGKKHWNAVKWVLRYLKRSLNTSLMYEKKQQSEVIVEGFVDSDYAGNIDTRKSLTGYILIVFGGVASWKSLTSQWLPCLPRKQNIWKSLRPSRKLYMDEGFDCR